MKSLVKVRVNVEPVEADFGKRYKVTKWIFECKTGRMVDHGTYGSNYSLKEARAVKKMILDSYL